MGRTSKSPRKVALVALDVAGEALPPCSHRFSGQGALRPRGMASARWASWQHQRRAEGAPPAARGDGCAAPDGRRLRYGCERTARTKASVTAAPARRTVWGVRPNQGVEVMMVSKPRTLSA